MFFGICIAFKRAIRTQKESSFFEENLQTIKNTTTS